MRTAILLAAAIAAASPAVAGPSDRGANFLEQWDADADGRVTLAEAEARREAVFYMFDASADGRLDQAELAEMDAHRELEREARRDGSDAGGKGPGRAGRMSPAAMDADGDGSVSQAEFGAMTGPMFDRLDRDGDGAVTSADFRRMEKRGKNRP